MDEENETAIEAVILDSDNGQTLVADLPSNEGEGENTVETEATRIEEIRAETVVAVAAIEADVETQRIEAAAERNENWDEEKATLLASIAELTERVETLALSLEEANRLTPTPQPETEPQTEVEIETVAELNLIPQSTPELTSEMQTELIAVEEEESAEAAETVPARKRRRLI